MGARAHAEHGAGLGIRPGRAARPGVAQEETEHEERGTDEHPPHLPHRLVVRDAGHSFTPPIPVRADDRSRYIPNLAASSMTGMARLMPTCVTSDVGLVSPGEEPDDLVVQVVDAG